MKNIIITLTNSKTEQLLFIDDRNKSLSNNENISNWFIFIMPPIKEMLMKKLKNYGIIVKKGLNQYQMLKLFKLKI